MIKITLRLSLFLLALAGSLHAQIPAGYYNSANGLTGTALQQALHDIIDNHTVVSYASLWTWFQQTDKKTNGKVWDMYSDIPGGTPPYEFTFVSDQCGNYGGEGDCYNREHSWPQSWFNSASTPSSDIFHLYPTDGYVNNYRGNYPYGKVGTATWTSQNGSKRGNCISPGYTGVVFEPRDEYKGDFARGYFYMETRYYNEDGSWANTDMTNGSQLLPWGQTVMLLWHLMDPVSDKEIARNNLIYNDIQHNRNPFIDHPEYAGQIWAAYMPTPGTYTWNVTSGNFSAAASWTPARTVAVPGDILIFDGAVKAVANVTLDITSAQSVARLRIINNATVSITSTTTTRTINIGVTGAASPQFEVSAGSTLNVNGTGAVTLNIASGFTGTVAGSINFQAAAHQLTGNGTGAITFSNGSSFTAGTGFTGTPFGTTALNSVTFASGSAYNLEAGSPPFGATAPSTVVVLQTGSTYRHKANVAPSLSGRTYSNFEINAAAFNQSVTTGTTVCTIDNLTVTSATLAGFDFPGGCTVKGNLTVTSGTLRFAPASTGILKFDATGAQSVTGADTLEIGPYCDVTIGTASATVLNKNLSLGRDIQILTGGTFTVNPAITLTVNGQAVIN